MNCVHPDDREISRKAIEEEADGVKDYSYVHRIIRPDGAVRTVREVALVHAREGGATTRRAGTVQDITEQANTEAALRESARRYRSLVEDQPEFVSRCTPDGTLTFANAAYAAQHGMRPDEMTGLNIFDFVPERQRDSVRAYIAGLGPDRPFGKSELAEEVRRALDENG